MLGMHNDNACPGFDSPALKKYAHKSRKVAIKIKNEWAIE